MDRFNHRDGNDEYAQPGKLWQLMSPVQRDHLYRNMAVAMQAVPLGIVEWQLGHLARAEPAYAEGVRKALRPQ